MAGFSPRASSGTATTTISGPASAWPGWGALVSWSWRVTLLRLHSVLTRSLPDSGSESRSRQFLSRCDSVVAPK